MDNQLFIQLANTEEKACLTIDCTGFNPNGPGRFRTGAEDENSQICFFNKSDDDHMFNVFVSKRIKGEEESGKILFEIEGVKSQTNNETYSAVTELQNLTENGLSNVRTDAASGFSNFENRRFQEKLEEVGSQPKQNFFQSDDNDTSKRKIKEGKSSIFSNQGKS